MSHAPKEAPMDNATKTPISLPPLAKGESKPFDDAMKAAEAVRDYSRRKLAERVRRLSSAECDWDDEERPTLSKVDIPAAVGRKAS